MAKFFSDRLQRKRYIYALLMNMLMIGVAGWSGEKEIIFPEMSALTIGMWIVDKRVWQICKLKMLLLMILGSIAGICIVRYSPFSLLFNFGTAFAFASLCLIMSRTTLIPLISACMLPVLLGTQSWVYPAAVSCMSLLLIAGQSLMEKRQIRHKIPYIPVTGNLKKDLLSWLFLLISVLAVASLSIFSNNLYFILPPLIVTYVEFARSKAGFRNRPVQVLLVLTTAAFLGSFFQWLLHLQLHLPEYIVAFMVLSCLFCLFEFIGKFFAPAGAISLIPMLLSPEGILWLPLQVFIGASIFISIAMICFQKCLTWPKAQLIVCLIPSFIRDSRKKDSTPKSK